MQWPEDMVCGEPIIYWPTRQELHSSNDIDTEVAIPDSWVDVGADKNSTNKAWSLVLTKRKWIRDDTMRFLPMYTGTSPRTTACAPAH